MNPWTLIGWIVLGFAALIIIPLVIWIALMAIAHHVMHRRTRDDTPHLGDVWIQGGTELRITRLFDNGRIGIETELGGGSKGSWSDSPEEWRSRVRKRKLWRSRP